MIQRRDLTAASVDGAPFLTITPSSLIDSRQVRRVADRSRLLRVSVTWHEAERHASAVALDASVAFGAAWWASGSYAASALATAALVATGVLLGVWKHRTSLETQGVSWLVRPLLPAILLAGVATGFAYHASVGASTAGAMAGALITVRCILWVVIGASRRRGMGLAGTLVIGTEQRVAQIRRRLETFPEAGLCFESEHIPDDPPDEAMLEKLVNMPYIDHVMCSVYDLEDPILRDVLSIADRRVDVTVVLPLSRLCPSPSHAHLGDLSLISVRTQASRGSVAAKRAFDVMIASLLALISSPIMLLAALAVRIGDPGPIIFKQRRVGKDGRPFMIYKFRSMITEAESHQVEYLERNVHQSLLFKLERDPRITKVGGVIRRLSIDELPQLFNVLKGDMSLVGPRPLAVDPDAFDTTDQLRHQILPGITGLWQIKGANALPYSDMVELDLMYVATQSFGLDLMIMLRTIPAIFIRRAPY